MLFIPVLAKLNFKHHYSNIQCHMILQESFGAQLLSVMIELLIRVILIIIV